MVEAPTDILVVEDEKNLGSTLVERLEKEGFQVQWVTTQSEALSAIQKKKFHLALLDVGLPDGSGFEIARVIRSQSPSMSLIFLTAFGTPEDRVKGLELGAEDYVVKPFHSRELILRMRNVLRRARDVQDGLGGQMGLSIKLGQAWIHFERFEAEREGRVHSLTHKEAALLKLLLENRGRVVSRDAILNYAWSEEEYPTPRTVDNFILRLRKLVEVSPDHPEVIKNVRGVGYLVI